MTLRAGGGRSGERHDVDPGIAGELGAEGVVRRGDDVEHAGGQVGLLGGDPGDGRRAPRRVGRRLEHDRAPGRERRADLGEVDLVGEVPRRDGADHAGRLAQHPAAGAHAHGRGLAQVGLPAVVGLGQVRGEAQVGDRGVELRRRAVRNGRRPDLGGGERPELLAVGLQGVAQLAQAPGPERRVGRTSPVASNARRAAPMAASMSAGGAVGGDAEHLLGGRVDVSNVAPPEAGASLPSMSRTSRPPAARSAPASPVPELHRRRARRVVAGQRRRAWSGSCGRSCPRTGCRRVIISRNSARGVAEVEPVALPATTGSCRRSGTSEPPMPATS